MADTGLLHAHWPPRIVLWLSLWPSPGPSWRTLSALPLTLLGPLLAPTAPKRLHPYSRSAAVPRAGVHLIGSHSFWRPLTLLRRLASSPATSGGAPKMRDWPVADSSAAGAGTPVTDMAATPAFDWAILVDPFGTVADLSGSPRLPWLLRSRFRGCGAPCVHLSNCALVPAYGGCRSPGTNSGCSSTRSLGVSCRLPCARATDSNPPAHWLARWSLTHRLLSRQCLLTPTPSCAMTTHRPATRGVCALPARRLRLSAHRSLPALGRA